MKHVFGFQYEEEFIDDLIYLNEIYGKEFECDGDYLQVKLVIETFKEDIK
ncbi:hypothetical protein [Escherichia phage 2725-N35]|uniref:Uncharacterized protein n=1 Tax=Escherichia phage 2725-N35 TaxID=2692738 RepID=A0A6B9SPW2_9CAUD|nr:hypothetical protein [Escherichia phage 2725-N35]